MALANEIHIRRTRAAAVVAGLALGVSTPVIAAPAGDMEAATRMFAQAEQQLAAGDPDGAVARFEEGLERLPPDPGYAPTRAHVLLTIVDAHEAAFAGDGELERLRRARRLLDLYLGPLDLLDEQGRAAAEDRRVRLIDVITAVEDRQRAEAEARAAALRRTRAEAARRRSRALNVSGATLTGMGVAGLVVASVGLGLGRATDRRIEALRADRLQQGDDWSLPCFDDACREARREQLAPLVARGSASNMLVVVGAVTGGALLTSGVVLLVLGRKKQREARQFELTPVPALGGGVFGLGLHGKF